MAGICRLFRKSPFARECVVVPVRLELPTKRLWAPYLLSKDQYKDMIIIRTRADAHLIELLFIAV
jgi:hypothetical protein